MATQPDINGQTPLTGALGIIGATVMPHNLYLHSAISQTRKIDYGDEENIAQTIKFTSWDSNIQLSMAFLVNVLLLVMGVAVFKTGAVKDPSFFGLYQALHNPATVSNHVLASVARSGVLSSLFAVALLASGQNSTITGTLTGQVIMEGFVHMRMPLWLRRLVTRLLSVIPVIICVLMTRNDSPLQEHIALNDLMNNSQVFLALALPFSMLPLIILTDSKKEMGRFKNSLWVKICGWIAIIILTFLNIIGLPDQMVAFFSDNPTKSEIMLGHQVAYVIIALTIILLLWTIIELYHSNKHLEEKKKESSD